MNTNARIIALLSILALELIWVGNLHAATPLPPAPVQGWCYASQDAGTYNGVTGCPNTPPPVDPGAYTTAQVTWMQSPNITRSTDVTQFFNVFGHINPNLPVQQWPGANGATVTMPDQSARYYRMRFTMPLNPGTLSHFLKAVSYGKSPANLRARFAVVAPGAPWPTGPDTPCWKSSVAFDDGVALNINPGAPNTSKCTWPAGATNDVLIDAIGNGVLALTFN